MSLGLAFWIILLISFVFGCWSSLPLGSKPYSAWGGNLLVFVLILLLGWKVFGPPIHS